MTIADWTAKRAGGRITINGYFSGQPYRVTNVDTIKCVEGRGIVATDKDGKEYVLTVPA